MKRRNHDSLPCTFILGHPISIDPDQPAHPNYQGGFRVFFVNGFVKKALTTRLANSEAPDQTVRLRRLIWSYTRCKCNKGHFLINWLIFDTYRQQIYHFKSADISGICVEELWSTC